MAALIVNLILAVGLRGQGPAFTFATIGFLSILVAFVIFYLWTLPANQATENWTTVPENWQALRTQWEYSHAVNAIIVFIGFCSILLAHSQLTTSRRTSRGLPGGF